MYVCDNDNAIDINTKRKDPNTFAKHSKVLRGHADVDFSATIKIEERNHKNNTRRKPFVRRPIYDTKTLRVKIGDDISNPEDKLETRIVGTTTI
jgi:hypothetical protein